MSSTTVDDVNFGLCVPALLTFRSQEKRDPEAASGEADLERLQQIKDHVLHDLKLDADIVDRTALKCVLDVSLDFTRFCLISWVIPLLI